MALPWESWDFYVCGATDWIAKNVHIGNPMIFRWPDDLVMFEMFKKAGLIFTRQGHERYERLLMADEDRRHN